VYEIGEMIDKWRSEHKMIAIKMDLAIPNHPLKQYG